MKETGKCPNSVFQAKATLIPQTNKSSKHKQKKKKKICKDQSDLTAKMEKSK